MDDNFSKFLEELENSGSEPKQSIDETFQGDIKFYASCLKKFSKGENLEALHTALAEKNLKEAIRAVHTMKGNADYLGLFPIMDAAVSILKDLRENNFEKALSDVPNLENENAKLVALLNSYPFENV